MTEINRVVFVDRGAPEPIFLGSVTFVEPFTVHACEECSIKTNIGFDPAGNPFLPNATLGKVTHVQENT